MTGSLFLYNSKRLTMTLIGVIATQELFIIFIILLVPLVALIEIIRSNFVNPVNKIVWVLLVLLLPFIGSLLFWIIGRSQVERRK